jgi:hypothetical protein
MDTLAVNVVANDSVVAGPGARRSLAPWSKRVRWVGGLIQGAFAAFWLARASIVIGGVASHVLLPVVGLLTIGVFTYALTAAGGTAPRPSATRQDKRIELQVTIATVLEFAAAIALPMLVTAAGHSDWTLPSIAITVGPLLLWLDHQLGLPRYRAVGWALTIGPLLLIATISGTALVATTGIAGGLLLLGTALAGFHDLAAGRSTTPHSASESTVGSAGAQL